MSQASKLEGLHELGSEGVVPVQFRTGAAGTGKTYSILQEIKADSKFGVLAATTGIAAMNLGTITLNSLLGYFNTESLEESFYNGWLVKKLTDLASDGYKWLVVDELSMMPKQQLDIIYQALKQMNEIRGMEGHAPLGLIVTGDFCQLPPIPDKDRNERSVPWAFDAECWSEFERSTNRLTKVWRQSDERFLQAINQIRSGNGPVGVALLQSLGVEFVQRADTVFDGTTIMSKNKAVDNFNWVAHSRLNGVPIYVTNERWGEQRGEWRNVPDQLALKKGALVMILANDSPSFSYVNGDLGHIEEFGSGKLPPEALEELDSEGDYERAVEGEFFWIRLKRNEQVVPVAKVTRLNMQKHPPDVLLERNRGTGEAELRRKYCEGHLESGMPYWSTEKRKWVKGALSYWPVRLGYASTVHKTQGLSLDNIQVDVNDHFFGSPAMAYVSISRCRTPQGLRIVGSPGLLAARVKVADEVKRWL